MPTTGLGGSDGMLLLPTLEQPFPLVAGDDLVEQPLLGAPVVEVVVDDTVSERGAGNRAALELGDRLAQGRGKPLRVRLVRVSFQRRRQLELLLDSVQPAGEQRREG